MTFSGFSNYSWRHEENRQSLCHRFESGMPLVSALGRILLYRFRNIFLCVQKGLLLQSLQNISLFDCSQNSGLRENSNHSLGGGIVTESLTTIFKILIIFVFFAFQLPKLFYKTFSRFNVATLTKTWYCSKNFVILEQSNNFFRKSQFSGMNSPQMDPGGNIFLFRCPWYFI